MFNVTVNYLYVYLTSQFLIDALIIEVICFIKPRMIAVHGRDPSANRGPATMVTITVSPINSSDTEILAY